MESHNAGISYEMFGAILGKTNLISSYGVYLREEEHGGERRLVFHNILNAGLAKNAGIINGDHLLKVNLVDVSNILVDCLVAQMKKVHVLDMVLKRSTPEGTVYIKIITELGLNELGPMFRQLRVYYGINLFRVTTPNIIPWTDIVYEYDSEEIVHIIYEVPGQPDKYLNIKPNDECVFLENTDYGTFSMMKYRLVHEDAEGGNRQGDNADNRTNEDAMQMTKTEQNNGRDCSGDGNFPVVLALANENAPRSKSLFGKAESLVSTPINTENYKSGQVIENGHFFYMKEAGSHKVNIESSQSTGYYINKDTNDRAVLSNTKFAFRIVPANPNNAGKKISLGFLKDCSSAQTSDE